MKILGLDPSTVATGWGFIDTDEGGDILSYEAGVIKTKGPEMSRKLAEIFDELETGIARLKPDAVALEEGFVGTNPKTSLYIGYARAICYVAAQRAGITPVGYNPKTVKRAVTSQGGATKHQVAQHVSLILTGRWSEDMGSISLDATDALAVALCYLNHNQESLILERIARP